MFELSWATTWKTSAQPFSRKLVIPLVMGILSGILIGIDAWLNHWFPYDICRSYLGFKVPYFCSIIVFLLIFASYFVIVNANKLFARRYFLAAAFIVLPAALQGFSYKHFHPTHLSILLVIIFFISAILIERTRFYTPLPITSFLLLLTAFIAGSIVNGLTISILTFYTMLTKVVAVFLITNLIVTTDVFRFALKCFMITAIVSAVVAVASEVAFILFEYSFTMEGLPEFRYKDTPFGLMLRVTAFMTTTQNLGHLLILGSCLIIFSDLSKLKRVLFLTIIAAAVAVTFSSGAYLVMGIVLLLSFFINKPSRSLLYITIIALISLAAYESGLLQKLFVDYFARMSDKNVGDRIEYIQAGIDALKRHPLLGIGLKNIGKTFHTPIHNAYLQMMVDTGIIGGLLFLFFIIYLLATSAIFAAKFSGTDKRLAKGVLLGMCALSVHFLFEPFYDNLISWMFMGFAAVLPVIYSTRSQRYGIQIHEAT